MKSHTFADVYRSIHSAILASVPLESTDTGPHIIEDLADHARKALPESRRA